MLALYPGLENMEMNPVKGQTPATVGAAVSGLGDALLVVDGISKSFGPVQAVRDLSFQARPGEIIGLLGPNGAGKTTAIRVLSTILPPTRGRFTLGGIPHTNPGAIRQQVGVLPESAGYPLHHTSAEFLRYHARLFGHPARAAREIAASLLAEVGLADRGSSPIATYSRGMRQRLGVARALVNAPSVIFLDEPTLGLDPAGQRQMLALIRDVAGQRGATVILSTHFLDEVEEVCSRVIILNRGEVIAEGSVADIKRRAAPRTVRVHVPPEMHDEALSALRQAKGIAHVDSIDGEQGWLNATLDSAWLEEHGGVQINSAIRALTDADVLVLSFELEGGRLSDAFLSLTEEGKP
jgi:ABC-2 type transport system ATP-binding protein